VYGQVSNLPLLLLKGVAYLYRYAQVSRQANSCYLQALCVVDDPTQAYGLLQEITRPKRHHGRSQRGFNPLHPDEARLFTVLLRGEHHLMGFRNQHLARHLYPNVREKEQRHRISARISRLLRRLRTFGLIGVRAGFKPAPTGPVAIASRKKAYACSRHLSISTRSTCLNSSPLDFYNPRLSAQIAKITEREILIRAARVTRRGLKCYSRSLTFGLGTTAHARRCRKIRRCTQTQVRHWLGRGSELPYSVPRHACLYTLRDPKKKIEKKTKNLSSHVDIFQRVWYNLEV